MPYYCTVPRCTSMAGKAKNVSFHQFPRDLELARLWNDILKRGKPYTKYSKVCSLHFRPEDYTITSVGKNKGQWRTLRKDAVPSQNLPSESPAPYPKKHWDSWSQSYTATNTIDPTIQQQVAQAIYMQTMLAMQAAGNSDGPTHNGPNVPELPSPHTSNHDKLKHPDTSVYKLQQTDTSSYKCNECTKCFKDPDVFILHKRTHSNKNVEKENFNMNLTLQSNPILANLLKSNSESFEPIVAMENLLMSALAANIDYIRNYSMNNDTEDTMNHDRTDLARHHGDNDGYHETHGDNKKRDRRSVSLDSDDGNQENEVQVKNDLVISRIEDSKTSRESDSSRLNPRDDEENDRRNINDIISSRTDVNRPRTDVTNCGTDVKRSRTDISSGTELNRSRTEMNSTRADVTSSGTNVNATRTDMNSPKTDLNSSRTGRNSSRVDMNNHRSDSNQHEENESSEHPYNVNMTSLGLHVRHINYEKDFTEEITTKRLSFSGNNYNGDVNDFHVRSSDDLNESMDSNNLVIDESVQY